MDDFLVQLEQRFDMVAGEGYRDKHKIRLAFLYVFLDGITGLCAEPGGWPDLGLPAKSVGVGEPKSLHHCVDSRCYFCWVCIAFEYQYTDTSHMTKEHTSVHDTHWQTVRREQQNDILTRLLWVGGQLCLHVLRKCFD